MAEGQPHNVENNDERERLENLGFDQHGIPSGVHLPNIFPTQIKQQICQRETQPVHTVTLSVNLSSIITEVCERPTDAPLAYM